MTSIRRITDTDLINRLSTIASVVVPDVANAPWDINLSLVREKSWVVVPVERGGHIEDDEADRLVRSIKSLGHEVCFAVETEDSDGKPICYEFPVTREGFFDFSAECVGLNYLVLSENADFFLHYTSEEYNTVAGPLAFVESYLGTDVATARSVFFKALSMDDPEDVLLRELAEQYRLASSVV